MKGLKTKLMISVSMLLIALVMTVSASYAWLTLSTNPEITSLNAQVVVNENLEIALLPTATAAPTAIPGASALGDEGTYTTWGNIIDLTSVISSGEVLRPITLTTKTTGTGDSAVTTAKFQYPKYGTDGRAKTALSDLIQSGFGKGNLVDSATGGKIYGYYVDFWVRSNMSGTLKLSTATKRSSAGEDGEGSFFSTNAVLDTATDNLKAARTFAENIQIAFLDITPNVTGATQATTGTYTIAATSTHVFDDDESTEDVDETEDYVLEATIDDGDDSTTDDDNATVYKTVFSDDAICTLTANNAKLIRMFVYVEGANITNAAASTGDFTNGGILNVQFKMDDVDNSMDGQS